MQHGDGAIEIAHKLHVVLDDHKRMVLRDFHEQGHGLLGLGIAHARDRLIEQHQLGLLCQQHADLEPLLLAVTEIPRQIRLTLGQPDGLQRGLDPGQLFAANTRKQARGRCSRRL